MYGSWEQGSLACTPNPTTQPLPDGSYNQSAYMIGVDDILGLKLQAKMVVMSCCYGNRHRDVQFQLPLALLVAGTFFYTNVAYKAILKGFMCLLF